MFNKFKFIIVYLKANAGIQTVNKLNQFVANTKMSKDISLSPLGAMERISLPTLLEDIKSYFIYIRSVKKLAVAGRNCDYPGISSNKNYFISIDSGQFLY